VNKEYILKDSKETIRDYQSIVSARGTTEGLVLRLDGRRDTKTLEEALREFMAVRKSFLEGQRVTIEWLGKEASPELAEYFSNVLEDEYRLIVETVRFRHAVSSTTSINTSNTSDDRKSLVRDLAGGESESPEDRALKSINPSGMVTSRKVTLEVLTPRRRDYSVEEPQKTEVDKTSNLVGPARTLFDGVGQMFGSLRGNLVERSGSGEKFESSESIEKASSVSLGNSKGGGLKFGVGNESELWDEPDARVVYATLRSGQRIETEHSIIILGDVNSGAEIVAGGDIIVLGALRGVAHAGAFDESGGGRIIFAHHLEPTQLRIGTVITRGLGEGFSYFFSKRRRAKEPEIAKVDGDTIVVERYNARQVRNRGSFRENLG